MALTKRLLQYCPNDEFHDSALTHNYWGEKMYSSTKPLQYCLNIHIKQGTQHYHINLMLGLN